MIAYRIQPTDRAALPTESTTWTDGEDVRAGASCCHSEAAVIAYFQRSPDGSRRSRTYREHLVGTEMLTVEGTWSDVLDHDADRADPHGHFSPLLVTDGVIIARRAVTAEEIAEILICDILPAWEAAGELYSEEERDGADEEVIAAARAAIAAEWGVSVETIGALVEAHS